MMKWEEEKVSFNKYFRTSGQLLKRKALLTVQMAYYNMRQNYYTVCTIFFPEQQLASAGLFLPHDTTDLADAMWESKSITPHVCISLASIWSKCKASILSRLKVRKEGQLFRGCTVR